VELAVLYLDCSDLLITCEGHFLQDCG
jgi:hypothetical protein